MKKCVNLIKFNNNRVTRDPESGKGSTSNFFPVPQALLPRPRRPSVLEHALTAVVAARVVAAVRDSGRLVDLRRAHLLLRHGERVGIAWRQVGPFGLVCFIPLWHTPRNTTGLLLLLAAKLVVLVACELLILVDLAVVAGVVVRKAALVVVHEAAPVVVHEALVHLCLLVADATGLDSLVVLHEQKLFVGSL